MTQGAICAGAIVAGGGAGVVIHGLLDDGSAPPRTVVVTATATPSPPPAVTTAAPAPTPAPGPSRADLARLVERQARRTGGRVQLAVADGDRVVAAASSGSVATPVRMWSVSKVVTAIALLRSLGWGERRGRALGAPTTRAVTDALVRSADCAQRQMVVALQQEVGGPEPARAALQDVLADSGARHAEILTRASTAGTGCAPVLDRSGLKDPYGVALQVGTAEWDVRDAARFGLALGDGTYPRAIRRRILGLLRRPKLQSNDPYLTVPDVSSDLAWGAGIALRGLHPAYKWGAGGSSGETPTFVVEQVIFATRADGRPVGIATTFEPPEPRPVRDDPGLTEAPRAFAGLLRPLARTLDLAPSS